MTMRVGDRGKDVVEVKRILREGGYFSGPDDDFYGEDLAQAVRAYQTAHGIGIDGVVGPETWGNMHGDPKYPNNSTGKIGGGGGGGGDTAAIKEKYPQLAYLIDDPEIGPILAQAEREGWAADKFQAKIMSTNWWRSNEDSARKYYNLQHTDPATFQSEIWNKSDELLIIAGELGYDETVMSPGYLNYFAHKALKQGLTPAQMRAMLASEITPLIGTTEKSPILQQMRQIQQEYQIAIDNPSQNYWLASIGSGRQSIDNFRSSILAQAKALFPNLVGQFESGMTLKQITEPYRRQIAETLELDPQHIDFVGQAKWRHVIDYVDPKDGTHRSMSNQELGRYLRSQTEYWNTRAGKDSAGEMVEGILTDFGAVRR